ncbi:hypothetical protein CQW23_29128 [Capsicum baccatum]|uniref:Homologous-pairing protein 2 homolog n=1 Tax=Capsicum baccatum TaxID=33114 RepID=A0A2G2VIG3_CAPBA|nr:hypothetical protein CQW23_29128 [Capsicum baccatum]
MWQMHALQKFNLKKTAVQKVRDNLCDSGKISFKECGKQKIYLARQDQFNIPDSEELNKMKEENANLQEQLNEQKKAISEVEAGVTLVSPEDRLAIEGLYSEALNQRRRRKRMFRDVWDAITENSPKNPKEFKEELGVEYNEDVGVNFQSFADLIQHGRKRR